MENLFYKILTITETIYFRCMRYLNIVKNAYLKSPNDENIYYVEEIYKNLTGIYIVVCKVKGNSCGVFSIPATELITKRQDILSNFDITDIINIVSIANSIKYNITLNDNNTATKFFPFLALLFSTSLIITNIQSSKLFSIFNTSMPAGIWSYSVTYILGDIITEVYGYKKTRTLIWGTIVANVFAMIFIYISINLPPSPYYAYQTQYSLVLGAVPRIIIASMASYWASEFLNSYIIARLKILQKGQQQWIRIISASIISISVDSVLFMIIAYAGKLPILEMIKVILQGYIFSITCEILAVPLIVIISIKLKRIEHIDIYDYLTNFSPFSMDINYEKLNNNYKQTKSRI